MKNFIGIDLGTTNSAICSYGGAGARVWKSIPEQNDVTPSAILYIGEMGRKFVGKQAYDMSPGYPNDSAEQFKRLMGTSTPINFASAGVTKTPEECSAEILKELFGYLPEEIRDEIRDDVDTGTVITVPAAFNQMQKTATMQAADIANIGKVALMQEPVAAATTFVNARNSRNSDGRYLIYDLGGGTFDAAVAEISGGRVQLLSLGGIAMCGGRDFDRALVDNIVLPWLHDKFDLPEDNLRANPDFMSFMRFAERATERAKIELSSRKDAQIILLPGEGPTTHDLEGNEIYLDIPLQRDQYERLIEKRIIDTVNAARETIKKARLSPDDLKEIVFVGGPTHYKPLRDKVSFEIEVPGSTDVNPINTIDPMTAVAEGASLFAESIDWSSQNRSRKSTRSSVASKDIQGISFNYYSRTSDAKAKIVAQITGEVPQGSEFQIDSVDTGWTSGRLPLKHGTIVDLNLDEDGENTFKVFAFDSEGRSIALEHDKIVITRTAATIDAIPASHSIAVEVLDKLGGRPVLAYLIRSGDSLPHKHKMVFKAAESLKAGAPGALNFKLWEGEVEYPIKDNRPIGVMKISGSDMADGVIHAGADLEFEYEMGDSGAIYVSVSVPSIRATFEKNFYSRQEGQLDYSEDAGMIREEGEKTMHRVDEIGEVVSDLKLEQAREKLRASIELDPEEGDIEKKQEAMENVYEARKLLAQVRKEHLKEIRQLDLDSNVSYFDENFREDARTSEEETIDNLVKTAQRSIDNNDNDFEDHLDMLWGKICDIRWRQDWYIIARFKNEVDSPHMYYDKSRFNELKRIGTQAIRSDDIDKLRNIIGQLWVIRISEPSDDERHDPTNIVRK